MSDKPNLQEIAATAAAISKDSTTDPVDVRRQHRRLAGLVAHLADAVAKDREILTEIKALLLNAHAALTSLRERQLATPKGTPPHQTPSQMPE